MLEFILRLFKDRKLDSEALTGDERVLVLQKGSMRLTTVSAIRNTLVTPSDLAAEVDALETQIDNVQTAVDAKPDDGEVVHTTGDESVGGVKTWTGESAVFPTLITYADEAAAAAGNVQSGWLYMTPTGEIRIKL